VLCESKADAERIIITLKEWLAIRGLQLSEEKTQIVHLTQGFDFLSFHIRLYSDIRRRRGEIRLITPSKEAVKRHRDKMREEWLLLKGKPAIQVVQKLTPKITGWANYFKHQVATATFQKLDSWMFRRECRYVSHHHPNRSRKWGHKRYWGKLNPRRNDNWVFGDKRTGRYLPKYQWTLIARHPKIKGRASPDDPSLKEYWKQRTADKTKELSPSYQKIAQNQEIICPICGETLHNGEELQKDHIVPRHKGGGNGYDNYQLLHTDCHKQKTAVDWSKREPTRKWLRKWLA
jgi:RNA-directed DNA polymerase